jgi:ABC-type branched-subunit amino acid transport system substrate-binding protein
MLYCPNPDCEDRENSYTSEVCRTCKTPLLIHDHYHIIHPLRERETNPTEIFFIRCLNTELPFVLKTLISKDDKTQKLFQREQQLLMKFTHEGIPRGHDTFSISLANGKKIPCLVMDLIPGENLEQWIKSEGAITQEQAINWLKQLLNILDYLHQQGIVHRDIKPSNIMRKPDEKLLDGKLVLIDFGAIKQIKSTEPGTITLSPDNHPPDLKVDEFCGIKQIESSEPSTSIGSEGYSPPEQCEGKAVLQSDFYALGRTFMHLLRGSGSNSSKPFVSKHLISPDLHKLLSDMAAEEIHDRPANVQIIRRRLRRIEEEQVRQRWQQIGLGFGIGMLCGGMAMIPLMRQINWEMEVDRLFPKATCDQTLHDHISCGEESLFQESDLESFVGRRVAEKASEVKKEGIQHIGKHEWQQARQSLQLVWEQTKDPETLIYLNNLKIQTEPKLQQQKGVIAVVAPLGGGSTAAARGFNILRGIAQAQDEAIQAGLGLQVVLVDDQNDPRTAHQLAKELVRRKEILAVIGHHVSDATRSALEVYDSAGMVLISPTSTSEELATYTLKKHNIFFRTVSSDRATATFMASFLLNRTKARKVAVFYNPDKSYSRSLAGAFKETFQALQGSIVNDETGQFYLSCIGASCQRPEFKLTEATQYAKRQGAEAFVVVPDAAESQSNAFSDAIDIVQSAGKTWVIMGDTMAGEAQLLNDGVVNHTIIASPWDPNQAKNSKLVKFWLSSSAPPPYRQPSWHTYTTYNAAQMLITAIKQHPRQQIDRIILRERLAAPGFSAKGASDEILRFRDGTGELQKPQVILTQVMQCGGQVVFRTLDGCCRVSN